MDPAYFDRLSFFNQAIFRVPVVDKFTVIVLDLNGRLYLFVYFFGGSQMVSTLDWQKSLGQIPLGPLTGVADSQSRV